MIASGEPDAVYRLTLPERELVRQLGDQLYGKLPAVRDVPSAADVFAQLPPAKPQGQLNAWPAYFQSFANKVGQEPRMRLPRPSPRQITDAEEATSGCAGS